MTQRISVLYGELITDASIHRATPMPSGVYEGLIPSVVTAGAGWTVSLTPGSRGVSVWRTLGTALLGRHTIYEDAVVNATIATQSAQDRIDVIVGVHKWLEGPLNANTGLPTGELTTEMQATYAVIEGTPGSNPVMPTVPYPFDGNGRGAIALMCVRVYASGATPTMWVPMENDQRPESQVKVDPLGSTNGLTIVMAAAAPGSPTLWMIWGDTGQSPPVFKQWNGTAWIPFDVGGRLAENAQAFTTAGTAPAFTLTPVPALAAYAAGQCYRVKFNAAGTTGSNTLAISGLAIKNLKQYDSTGAKVSAVISANLITGVIYDGTDFVVLDPLPPTGGLVGSVVWVAQNSAPTGYLKANGALVSRSTYAALFAAIGTVFGVGDGSTTFGLPDLRGEFVRGWADDRAVDTGRVFGSAQAEMIGPHTHSVKSIQSSAAGGGGYYALYGAGNYDFGSANNTGTENRPRNVAMLACIKY